ncbi:MAG TPA: SCO family protein [Xanthobacteraceae bacterium]|nr:SCO family protein [Xanthobacteraceae bacterium]
MNRERTVLAVIALAAFAASAAGAASYAKRVYDLQARVAEQNVVLEAPQARLMEELMWNRTKIGGPFTLTDHTGKKRALDDFRGRFTLLYFGFTNCPDICPTDLYSMSKAIEELGSDGEKVNLVFVTLDPERDTPEKLSQYISLFHPRLVALTGTPGEIRSAANLYKVYFQKTKLGEGANDYTVDHSAFVYLLNAEGRYLGFYPPNTSPDRIAQIVRQWLQEKSASRTPETSPN